MYHDIIPFIMGSAITWLCLKPYLKHTGVRKKVNKAKRKVEKTVKKFKVYV